MAGSCSYSRLKGEIKGWHECDCTHVRPSRAFGTWNEVSHPEDFCERCKQPNVTWFAPSALWNAAHGEWDILCPVCFITLAEATGINATAWRVTPEESDELTKLRDENRKLRYVAESAATMFNCAPSKYMRSANDIEAMASKLLNELEASAGS